MADVMLKPVWNIQLSTEELRIVCKGLTGTLESEEIPAARELAELLTKKRIGSVKSFAQSADKLEENVAKAKKTNNV